MLLLLLLIGRYAFGEGVKQSYRKAFRWYSKVRQPSHTRVHHARPHAYRCAALPVVPGCVLPARSGLGCHVCPAWLQR